jgi:hypothetical protein
MCEDYRRRICEKSRFTDEGGIRDILNRERKQVTFLGVEHLPDVVRSINTKCITAHTHSGRYVGL